jgi:hypothetical protein
VNAALISGLFNPEGIAIVATPTVPEPSTWPLMLVGFAGLAFAGYRQQAALVGVRRATDVG